MIELGIVIIFFVLIFTILTRRTNNFRKNIKEGEFCHYYQQHKLNLGLILIIYNDIIFIEDISTGKAIILKKTDLYPPEW